MAGFEWNSAEDSDLFRSLSSLVKYNNGLFKSKGQAGFMMKQAAPADATKPEWMRDHYGIDGVQSDQRIIEVRASMVWQGRETGFVGPQSYRPIAWVFVIDGAGVVGQYKLRFTMYDVGHFGVNASKTESLWSRPSEIAEKAEDMIAQQEREKAEKAANATPAPEGRHQVTGKIVSTRVENTPYGLSEKMLVEDDRGFRVWTTAPRSLDRTDRGTRVQFMVQLMPKAGDPLFAIGKRPTKASVIQ